MAPEKANTLNKIIAWVSSGALTIVTFVWLAGGFYSTTNATNKSLPEHIEEDKARDNEYKSFQTSALIKLESLTVSLNFLTKEMERKNNLEEKYHNQHDRSK